MKKNLCAFLILLVMGISLATLNGVAKAVAAEAEMIPIATILGLSGASAAYGLTGVHGVEMAVEEINGGGGFSVGGKTYKFDLFTADNKYTVDGGRAAAEKFLYQKKGKFIAMCNSSGAVLGLQEITEPAKVLIFHTVVTPQAVSPQKLYSFRIMLFGYENSTPLLTKLKELYPKAKTIAFVAPNAAHGRGVVDTDKKVSKGFGWEVLGEEYYEMETADFLSVATKIRAMRPDIVGLGCPGASAAALILKSLYEVGWRGIKYDITGEHGNDIAKAAGKEASEGYLMGLDWDTSGRYATPELKKVAAKFLTKYREPMTYQAACGYCGVYTMMEAMNKANSIDSTAVRDALVGMKWDSVFGPTHIGGEKSYGVKRVFAYPAIVSQIQNGKSVDIAQIPNESP